MPGKLCLLLGASFLTTSLASTFLTAASLAPPASWNLLAMLAIFPVGGAVAWRILARVLSVS